MRLIDADEAVGTLRRMAKDCILRGKLQEGEEYAIAASVLNRKELADVLSGRNINEHIRQLEAQVPKWISVEERFPEGRVLAACFDPEMYCHGEYIIGHLGCMDESEYVIAENDFEILDGVTHWMSLPEPPKEEET